ncbi:MAG TPA: hypothetical protein VGP93_20200 [Polyangiaceae bacterium]|nr:hypothetical protein [Polyangiaceae bacterium]
MRSPVAFRWVALVFSVVFAVGVVVALLLHRTYVAAERVAARHVPADAAAVLRLDLEKVVLFAPVRQSLMPLLDELDVPEGKKLGPRWRRLASRSELVLGRDTREAVFLWGQRQGDWAVVLGGNFPDRVLAPLQQLFQEEGKPWPFEQGHLRSPEGLALGQAADRALILASDAARLGTVLPATDVHDRLGIPLRGALSFAANPRQMGFLWSVLSPLGPVEHLTARADWGSPLVVEIELTFSATPAPGSVVRARAILTELEGQDEAARLGREVGSPKIELKDQTMQIETRWDHIALERLAERIARHIAPAGAVTGG